MWWHWFGCGEDPEVRFARAKEAHDPVVLGELCDQGRQEACALAVEAAPDGDPRKAAWDEKACDGGALDSCLRRSTEPGDPFRDKACTLGDLPSCLVAGDAARARGDRAHAAELYAVRCTAKPEDVACVLAERMK